MIMQVNIVCKGSVPPFQIISPTLSTLLHIRRSTPSFILQITTTNNHETHMHAHTQIHTHARKHLQPKD